MSPPLTMGPVGVDFLSHNHYKESGWLRKDMVLRARITKFFKNPVWPHKRLIKLKIFLPDA